MGFGRPGAGVGVMSQAVRGLRLTRSSGRSGGPPVAGQLQIAFGNPTREWVGYRLWVVSGGTLVTLLVVRTLDRSV